MRVTRIWQRMLCVEDTIVDDVCLEADCVVVSVRPYKRRQHRCGVCGARCPRYDSGGGLRRWRALDLGPMRVFLESEAPRVRCADHGVVVAAVPWARHRARCTRAFDDTAAWLATQCSKAAVSELTRISWRTVGRIVTRVVEEQGPQHSRLDGLRRIGIDEISYRKGQRYLTVVIDHDTGDLVWAAPGANKAVVHDFFDLLGESGCRRVELVSADAAAWIQRVVEERCPDAQLCMDPFHVVQWATVALDEVRRDVWRNARSWGLTFQANSLKGARWALLKNADDLTHIQRATLAGLQQTNKPLYRAYLLKEQLRAVFQAPPDAAAELLESWLVWPRRCRIKPFVNIARTITDQRDRIVAAIRHRLTNARAEGLNTRIRLIARRAYGFHSPDALIALAMLSLGGLTPALPGRS